MPHRPHGNRESAECRSQLGMNVENRVRTIKKPNGTTYKLSEYRLKSSVQQLELL